MVDLDITKNNLSDATLTIPGDPSEAAFDTDTWFDSQSIESMAAIVTADPAYTEKDVLIMTKNDLVMAYRQVLDVAQH